MNKEIIPNAITISNGLCGFLSIILTSTSQYTYASVFIILAMFADRYDGMVIKKIRSSISTWKRTGLYMRCY